MNFVEVESSNIQGIQHDGNDLFVQFKTGAIYRYLNVPLSEFHALLDSDSKGKYLARNIKNIYEARKEEL